MLLPLLLCCCCQAAYGSQLPFPLSYIVPWSQRNEMAKLLGHIDGFKVGGCSLPTPAAHATSTASECGYACLVTRIAVLQRSVPSEQHCV
jgi:hypothetical protein